MLSESPIPMNPSVAAPAALIQASKIQKVFDFDLTAPGFCTSNAKNAMDTVATRNITRRIRDLRSDEPVEPSSTPQITPEIMKAKFVQRVSLGPIDSDVA